MADPRFFGMSIAQIAQIKHQERLQERHAKQKPVESIDLVCEEPELIEVQTELVIPEVIIPEEPKFHINFDGSAFIYENVSFKGSLCNLRLYKNKIEQGKLLRPEEIKLRSNQMITTKEFYAAISHLYDNRDTDSKYLRFMINQQKSMFKDDISKVLAFDTLASNYRNKIIHESGSINYDSISCTVEGPREYVTSRMTSSGRCVLGALFGTNSPEDVHDKFMWLTGRNVIISRPTAMLTSVDYYVMMRNDVYANGNVIIDLNNNHGLAISRALSILPAK